VAAPVAQEAVQLLQAALNEPAILLVGDLGTFLRVNEVQFQSAGFRTGRRYQTKANCHPKEKTGSQMAYTHAPSLRLAKIYVIVFQNAALRLVLSPRERMLCIIKSQP